MSGYSQIMEWAEQNVPFYEFESFDEWLEALNDRFESDNRNSIYEIFDFRDMQQANDEFLYHKRFG